MAQQRIEPDALGRRGVEARERVRLGARRDEPNSISPMKKTREPASTAVAHGTISRWRLRVP